MKKINLLSLILLLMAATFTGCGMDEPNENPAISVQDNGGVTQSVFADDTSGKSGVTFTTTGAWTSSISGAEANLKSSLLRAGSSTWISISPDHGDTAGTYTISISLEPNFTGSDRTAVITISCNGTDIAITVTQKSTKEDGTKPAVKQTVVFEAYSCNAQWSPQSNVPYLAAEGAEIKVYKGPDEVGRYITDIGGQAAAELEPGEYAYRIAKGSAANVPDDTAGFVIAGIFTSQEEANSLSQSGAQLGGLKFIDINGDGIINSADRVENGRAPLRVDADSVEMRVTAYIAPRDFVPGYNTFSYAEQKAQKNYYYRQMLSLAWQIDAAMTHEALPPSFENYANFTFGAYDGQLNMLWDAAYHTIGCANTILERIHELDNITEDERSVYRGEAQYYRAYAYSVLLNYFGGVPVIATATPQGNEPRNSDEEVRDFIMQDCDEAYNLLPAHSSSLAIRYAAQQIKARVLLNIRDFARATDALLSIVNAGMYQLPADPSAWGEDAISEPITITAAIFPSSMRKGNGTIYPIRYAETLLLYAEASLGLGYLTEALNTANQLALQQGLAPLNSGASNDEIRSALISLWSSQLNKEGCAFARLKRTGRFMETLEQYGAKNQHQRLPIPASVLANNPNMSQNPGW
jgi:hypothetical protein